MRGSIHLFERLPQVDAIPVAANDYALSPVRAKPLVGLIRNSRSHRNEARNAFDAQRDNVLLATPRRRSELPGILADFAAKRVDYIAIDGGDGTVRDVLTCGAGIFGDAWPMLIVVPNGKTNALAHDLGIPTEWTLDDAIAAAERGTLTRRQPLVIAQRDDEKAQVRGFVLGGGVFNRAIALGQRSHKLGAFNAAVVGVTAGWSVLQALFGRAGNAWRRGTHMRLRRSNGEELKHCGGLPADERYLLFASTLQSFPAGLDPFHKVKDVLRLAVFDNPRRSLLLRLGAIMRGKPSQRTLDRGIHLFGDSAIELDIAEAFILDGEAFPAGNYRLTAGPKLRFVVP
ncbi:diacylglycerol kinase family protein [Aurantiacibacter sp. MUD11]|uniref:diacylglycerol/lipid kinase family protein n=1 Tax=Aurantiacibacter sp. MUD11 TaxID=3003265 RepID=UPI0022AAB2E7|nr:diacylglycerol kinase family protein [Aurantiacibacter sp. MUD11]WAT17104.1 diacylglycerol kinase family protein [Aurantiacibacter sp. MUD11]